MIGKSLSIFTLISLLLFSQLYSKQKFVVITQPKTGSHLLLLILEKLTNLSDCNKKYNQHEELFGPFEICDEAFFLNNKDCLELIFWYFCLQPVSKEHFLQSLKALQKNKQFLFTHAPFTKPLEKLLQKKDYILFIMKRDPRDICVSVVNAFEKKGQITTIDDVWWSELPFNEKLNFAISGTCWYNSIRSQHTLFHPWLSSSLSCVIDYDHLVQEDQTGDERLKELRKIANALGVKIKDEALLEIFHSVYGKGRNFIRGKTNAWKEFFTDEHKELFKEIMGDILIELGYEDNYDW